MAVALQSWQLESERGPDWLFVKLTPPSDDASDASDTCEFAEPVWSVLATHFTYRVVLELEGIRHLSSFMIGQLIALQKRIHEHGGMLRISGLRPACEQSLRLCRLGAMLRNYRNREEAVLSTRPHQPR